MAKKEIQIPFDNNGMQTYPETHWAGFRWEPNRVFGATMQAEGFSRGRSAANLVLKGPDGRRYYMFLTDVADLLEHCTIDHGCVAGQRWTFVKRGLNYGLKLAEPSPEAIEPE